VQSPARLDPLLKRLLLAHNPAYWPSEGGSERVLEHILEGVRGDFQRVVVFTGTATRALTRNGVEIKPYHPASLMAFAARERPDVYFPNMVHSRFTRLHLPFLARCSALTVLNMVGGYPARTPLWQRAFDLRRARRAADICVYVDPLSTEWLVDRAIEPRLRVQFIPQGLNHAELDDVRTSRGERYVVHAHNLWSWKTPEILLTHVAPRVPDLRFRLIASANTGDAIAESERLVEAVPNAQIALGLSRRDFLSVIARADAVVSTSSVEGPQPNILLEAGYLGVPYLSLCPGQNYGHYPHVEMFATAGELGDRLRDAGGLLRDGKRHELERARDLFAQPKWRWDSVVAEYRHLFGGLADGRTTQGPG
jgi:glycosyltransferase involved in cell wall biosynthesis